MRVINYEVRKKSMQMKVDRDLMYRFFQNTNTEEEAEVLGRWLKESEANEQEFRKAYDVFLVSQMFLTSDEVGKVRTRAEEQMQKQRRRTRTVWLAAGIAASMALGFYVSDRLFTKPVRDLVEESTLAFSNSPGQITTITLSDGTVVHLNADSRIEYPAVFYGNERRVRLEGEAIFDVEHDERKPFIVETFRYDVRVLGTKFDVVAEEDEGLFSTALLEGKVSLTDKVDGRRCIMTENTVAKYADGGLRLSSLDNRDDFLWTEGIISAAGLPFDRLMEKFEKYYNVKIVLRRDTLPKIGYGRLRIRISDGIYTALDILKRTSDFTYTCDTSESVIYID